MNQQPKRDRQLSPLLDAYERAYVKVNSQYQYILDKIEKFLKPILNSNTHANQHIEPSLI